MTAAQQKAMNAIGEAAAEWVVRLNGSAPDAADNAAFMQWLRQSPLHVQEYLRAEVLFLAMQGATREDSSDVRALLREASPNVALMEPVGRQAAAAQARTPSRRRFVGAALAAALVLAIGAAWMLQAGIFNGDTYSTGVGEQRRIVLPDGSTIELNTRSNLRVNFTAGARDIHLSSGEAFFVVARDAQRPFRVMSDTAVVRAVGTQFNVHLRSDKTVVTVIEGRVAVTDLDSDRAPGKEVVVDPGQGIDVGAPRPAAADTRLALAWQQRRLIFEDCTLAEVVAEFNRYNRREFRIEGAALAAQRISGVFDADKPEDLIGFLVKNAEARVDDSAPGHIVLEPR